MKVIIEGVDQRLMFSGPEKGKVKNWLVLALPNGEHIHAMVEDRDLNNVLSSVDTEFVEEAQAEAAPEFQPPAFDDMPQPQMGEGPQPVQYYDDSDEEAPPADVPPGTFESFVGAAPDDGPQPIPNDADDQVVAWEELDEQVLPESMKKAMRDLQIAKELPTSALVQVTDRIAERMMAQATLAQPPHQPIATAQQPVRTRVVNAVPPRRTVPTTEYGYPKVAGMDNDPGEFAHNADEDGVGQL